MANKAMKMRHWERLTNVTGHVFEIESDTFLLRNIMEAPLLENKEDIEVCMNHRFHQRYKMLVPFSSSHGAPIGCI